MAPQQKPIVQFQPKVSKKFDHIQSPESYLVVPEYEDEVACARRFGVSIFFLRKLRYQNKIPAAALNGRMVRYPVAAVREYFEKATAVGAKGKCGAVHGKWAAKRAPAKRASNDQTESTK